ncbi:MAG: ATP-binding protein [Vicinamibacterales bacterium]
MSAALVRAVPAHAEFLAACPDGMWCVELPVPVPVSMPVADAAEAVLRIGRVTTANDAAAGLLGLSRGQDLAGRRLSEVVTADIGTLRSLLVEFITAGHRLPAHPVTLADRSGVRSLVHTLTGVVEGGSLVRIWGVQRLAADAPAVGEPLHHVQKLAVIGQVARSVAHDFNNLLTAIMGYGEMVNDALPQGSDSKADMKQVLAAAGRAETLTRQLLTFSRRQRRAPEAFDLDAALFDLQPLLRRLMPDSIEVVLELSDAAAMIHGVRGQIELAVVNLALNARDAMVSGGTLTIGTSAGVRETSGVDAAIDVRLRVQDTGTGMTPEVRARMFQPFFTTRPEAPGIGLATVHTVVSQHRGRLEVESVPGVGTTVTIVLGAITAQMRGLNVTNIDTFRGR